MERRGGVLGVVDSMHIAEPPFINLEITIFVFQFNGRKLQDPWIYL